MLMSATAAPCPRLGWPETAVSARGKALRCPSTGDSVREAIGTQYPFGSLRLRGARRGVSLEARRASMEHMT